HSTRVIDSNDDVRSPFQAIEQRLIVAARALARSFWTARQDHAKASFGQADNLCERVAVEPSDVDQKSWKCAIADAKAAVNDVRLLEEGSGDPQWRVTFDLTRKDSVAHLPPIVCRRRALFVGDAVQSPVLFIR